MQNIPKRGNGKEKKKKKKKMKLNTMLDFFQISNREQTREGPINLAVAIFKIIKS